MRNFARKHLDRHAGILNSAIRASHGGSDFRVLARAKKDDQEAQLLIMGDIGDSWWGESITAKEVVLFLADHRGENVRVKIDTGGGDAYDGMAIMNALLMHDGDVTGEIMGLCYSAGTLVALGCETLEAHKASNFGIHPAHTVAFGNRHEMQNAMNWLDTVDTVLLDTYEDKTGMDRSDLEKLFNGNGLDGTIMTATQAMEYGFIDHILSKSDAADDAGDSEDTADTSADDSDSSSTMEDSSGPCPRSEAVDPEEDMKRVAENRRQLAAARRKMMDMRHRSALSH